MGIWKFLEDRGILWCEDCQAHYVKGDHKHAAENIDYTRWVGRLQALMDLVSLDVEVLFSDEFADDLNATSPAFQRLLADIRDKAQTHKELDALPPIRLR